MVDQFGILIVKVFLEWALSYLQWSGSDFLQNQLKDFVTLKRKIKPNYFNKTNEIVSLFLDYFFLYSWWDIGPKHKHANNWTHDGAVQFPMEQLWRKFNYFLICRFSGDLSGMNICSVSVRTYFSQSASKCFNNSYWEQTWYLDCKRPEVKVKLKL